MWACVYVWVCVRERDAERPLGIRVCLFCGNGFKEKFVHIACCAESSRYFALTDHPGMLHKYCLIKCVCVCMCMRGRRYSLSTCVLVEIGAICPPLVAFRLTSYGWRVWVFFFPDEKSEPELLCQEDAERNNWMCFIGKFWCVFMCMCQTSKTLSDADTDWVTGEDCGLCF